MRFIFAAIMLSVVACHAGEPTAQQVQALEKKLHGYWGSSEKGIFNTLLRDAKKRGEVSDKRLAELKKQAKKLSLMMVRHYSPDGKITMYTTGGEDAGTYEVTFVRLKKSEVDIEIRTERHGRERGTIFVGDDFHAYVLKQLPRPKPFVHDLYTLVKISEEEAKKRIKGIEEMKKARERK